jgi:hypothetical protein
MLWKYQYKESNFFCQPPAFKYCNFHTIRRRGKNKKIAAYRLQKPGVCGILLLKK